MSHYTLKQITQLHSSPSQRIDAAMFFDHIDTCADCNSIYQDYLLPSAKDIELLTDIEKEQLFKRVKGQQKSGVFVKKGGVIIPFNFRLAAPAIAALLVLALIPIVGHYKTSVPVATHKETTSKETGFVLASCTGVISINGKPYSSASFITDEQISASTLDGQQATIRIDELTLTLLPKTTISISRSESKKITVSLVGSIDGQISHDSGKDVYIEVPGGCYHIVGTIFHITTTTQGSRIAVDEGRVAYLPSVPELMTDTIDANESREFMVRLIQDNVVFNNSVVQKRHDHIVDSAIDEPGLAVAPDSSVKSSGLLSLQQARGLIIRGQIDEGIDLLKVLLKSGDSPDALALMGWAYEKKNMGDKASDYYKKYLEVSKFGTYCNTAYEGIVSNYFKLDDFSSIEYWLKKWIAAAPDAQEPVYILASTSREKGKYQAALRYYEDYIFKAKKGIFSNAPWTEESLYYTALCHKWLKHDQEYKQKVAEYKTAYPDGQFTRALK